MDHIGRIPKLVNDGFPGEIFSTKQTREIAPFMYEDALKVMRMENPTLKEEELIYQQEDVERTLNHWQDVKYHEPFIPVPGFEVEFFDAGHILGSAFIKITVGGQKVVFTGDVGNSPSPLVRQTERVSDADYMVTESVYGDRLHEGRDERQQKLEQAIRYILKTKGALIIPAFSLERTQIIIHAINDMVEGGKIPRIPVFLDSPLAIKLTGVYQSAPPELLGKHINEDLHTDKNVFDFEGLSMTSSTEESKQIFKVPGPKVIIAGSGMSAGGRVIHHERHFLEGPENFILFVGYQSPRSLGREIQNGVKEVQIFGKKVKVKAKVDSISGYSSHADRDQLLDFVEASAETLKKVFVAMGEPKSSLFLAQRINDYLGVKAIVPEEGDSYLLE
jgi:metallo-beta-lactamase family protein